MVALALSEVLLPLFFLPLVFVLIGGLALALFSRTPIKRRKIMAPVGWTGTRPSNTKTKTGVSFLQKFYDTNRSEDKVKLFPPWRNKVSKLQKTNVEGEHIEKETMKKGKSKSSDRKITPPRVIAAEMKKKGFGATVIEVNYNPDESPKNDTPQDESLNIQKYHCNSSQETESSEGYASTPEEHLSLSTVIAVNYNSNEASSEEFDSVLSSSDDSLPPLPPKMKDITTKNYFKNGTNKRLSHYDNFVQVGEWQLDIPPPIPPLPFELRERYLMDVLEDQNTYKNIVYGKPSRIPKPNPSPNNLSRVDSVGRKEVEKYRMKKHTVIEPLIDNKCQTKNTVTPKRNATEMKKKTSTENLLEDLNIEKSKNKMFVYKLNGEDNNNENQLVDQTSSEDWDELFERYEALERECEMAEGILASDQSCNKKNLTTGSLSTTTNDSVAVNCPTKQQVLEYNDTNQLSKSSIVKSILQAKIFEEKKLCDEKVARPFPKTNRIKDNKCASDFREKEKSVDCILVEKNTKISVGGVKSDSKNVQSEVQADKSVSLVGDYPGIELVAAKTAKQVGSSLYRTEVEIFFRSGVLAQLEGQRDERLTSHVVRLQSRCRGYLARRKLAKLKVQDVAVRCIQRNVRKLLSVQDWPWWKLLTRVQPLLNVHRTEEQLKVKTEELESLRSKVDKLESERGQLQHENDKLGTKLSEMTADLADEHSTSILATERLEAETSERLRLERELQEIQVHHQSLSATTERLEMELLYLRATDGPAEEDDEAGADAGVYKQRYERTMRELELTKHRLHQQHEDDLEQLVALKKQLEKKLGDAYEEVNEQRQCVGQWKRKVQKLTAETNDLRLLLEEQNSRNTLLEKKQRRFDSEFQLLQEQFRQEKQHRERASREKEMALGEKYTMEQNLSAIRLELELKEEHANALSRELDELTTGGHTDIEVASLKRAKHELDKKLLEQEEELDDLAGQLALLGQAKLRIEMSLEQQRKESRREAAQRDEELEDVRCNATKKVKALESQLESEHEERTLLLREKHDLERRLSAAQDQAGRTQQEQEQLQRLKRDLKRTKALLKDAHIMLQKSSADAPAKALLRQLRNQLEDAELARASAVKARQGLEAELSEVQGQLDEAHRGRSEAEDKAGAALRERQDLRTQLDENEEELAEVLKKYRGCVQQLSTEQLAQQEQAAQVAQLESERSALKEQLVELTTRLECAETLGDPGSSLAQRRLELKTREMESRLELEQTTRARLEVQISRLKDAVEKLQSEAAHVRSKEQSALAESRKLARSLREAREEVSASVARETETGQRKKDAETRLDAAQAETQAAKADLRLALTRINDLQTAIQDDCSQTDSDRDSESDESIESFLVNHDTSATWEHTRISLSRSPPRHSPSSSDLDTKSSDLVPKTIADHSNSKESYA